MNNFDPLKFLDINPDQKEQQNLANQLLNKISEYILLRTLELLPEEEIKNITNPEKIFLLAKIKIPDFDNQIKLFLSDFKSEKSKRKNQKSSRNTTLKKLR